MKAWKFVRLNKRIVFVGDRDPNKQNFGYLRGSDCNCAPDLELIASEIAE